MRILLASSEVHPYSKTGGLADMVGALGKTLTRAGNKVGLVTPLYEGVRERFPQIRALPVSLELALGAGQVTGKVWALDATSGLTVYFVDAPVFYERKGLYQTHGVDYPDNAERFIFFSKAVAHLGRSLDWVPEVVHLHDWQTAFAALFLRHAEKQPHSTGGPRTCMTIHNLAYQGLFPSGQFPLTNLPWDYFTPEGVEFYGGMNCLKAGIAFADVLTTVSPGYAGEIKTPELGCGLDGLLRKREDKLFGILNGVDYEEWDTKHDPYLPFCYSADEIEGKARNKEQLQREIGLPVDSAIPLFGSIGRLVDQKGVDLMLAGLQEMLNHDLQFVLLGTGAPQCEERFCELSRLYPAKAAARIGFDEAFSHRIEAGCDFFLMPSRFEPCGLNQMYSLRYGTIPIVRATGGLNDTVIDIRENESKANGIKFQAYSAAALAKAIRKALALFEERELFHRFRLNAMAADFSWERTAAEYMKAYKEALTGINP